MPERPPLESVVERLSDPAIYPNRPDRVEVRETHASVAFLAGDEVYKLKKPVDYGFLDYSTQERRREMCEFEVELNRRLAPDVYLGVAELVMRDRSLSIGGEGEVIDSLVHMRRLPDDASLAAKIEADTAIADEIDAVAHRIAKFHRDAVRSRGIANFGTPDAVMGNVEENFEQTRPYLDITIPRGSYETISGYARHFLERNASVFHDRIDAGLICDGHGDLRAEHVYLLPDGELEIIDCIEFNDRLRYGDVAVDLGFLAMDLDAYGRPDLSDRLVASYQGASGYDLTPVLDFYRSYRAYVRGKVASFRLDLPDLNDDEARDARLEARHYFHLAHRYAVGDRGPRLLITVGLTGSGKSTLARALAAVLPATVIDSDLTRKELAGIDPTSRQESDYGAGIYSAEMSARVYETLLERAAPLLAQKRTVILDATYIRRADRGAARELADEYDARFLAVQVDISEELARQRLAERGEDPRRVSDGRWEIFVAQREEFEPLEELATDERITTSAAEDTTDQLEAVLSQLERTTSTDR